MTQALQNQPFAKLKPVTRCTASYVKENDKLRFDLQAAKTELERKKLLNEELREFKKNWIELKEWMKGKKINFSGDDRFWQGYEDFYYDVKAKLKELEEG